MNRKKQDRKRYTRTCLQCGEDKSPSCFPYNKDVEQRYWCIACIKEYEYRLKINKK